VTRVLVVAASAIARAGLRTLLESAGAVEVTGSVASWSEFPGGAPDVIVADWEGGADELPQDLMEAAAGTAIVAVVDEPSPAATAEALRAGVRAVLPRRAGAAQLVAAVEAAAAGLTVLAARDVEALLAPPLPARGSETLTPREIEVLGMLAEGYSNKETAYRMGISEHTVKFHVTSIMAKLNAGSRTEAVTLGIRRGWILL
jgi:NarL family two-component system response regulator YdfI